MITTTPPLPSPTDRAPTESPFLPSDPSKPPNLAQIEMCTAAVAEAQQQMKVDTIDLPFPRQRDGSRMRARMPITHNCVSPNFVMIWNGFCSARRMMYPRTMEEAEQMVVSETMELEAYAKEIKSADNSLPPRGMSFSLVVPKYACSGEPAVKLLDGMAALSDIRTPGDLPIATKARFAVYGSILATPIEKVLRATAFGATQVEGISVIMRWAELDSLGNPSIRTECEPVREPVGSDPKDAARIIQAAVVYMATAYGADLPANMFTPAPDTIPRQFEHQFAKCSDEFCAFLNHRDEFSPSEAMRKAGCTLLSIVPGVMLRMSARAAGLGGVTSNNAMHALLLCADGQEGMARDFVITNREGLPPLPEERASKLLLHTVAVQVEPMKLNGAVTLFAQGGKPGEPIQSPGSWVWRSSAAIVPIEKVMENFFVMSCGVESTLPKRCSMRKFMQTHMQRSMDMFNSTFDRADINAMLKTYCAKRKSPDAPLEALTEEDRLSMVAIGIDMNSKRLCLGQTITHLMTHTSCKSALLDMLIKASTRVGLSASLESMFASCVSSMEKEDENIKNHKLDVERLKRVTDAALVMALSRKQEKAPVIHTSADKVRTLMKAFSLQAGRTTCSIKDMADMDSFVARSMVCTVYEAYEGRMCKNAPHADQVESLFCAGAELLVATCKALKVCMVEPGEEKDAFVIMHGDSKEDTVRVFRVGSLGDPEACGIGPAFESRMPVVLIIKFKTENSCLVTPLVRKPA